MIQIEIYEEFSRWLDCLLENNDMPENTAAFCFNLYEESDEEHLYAVQLVAAGEFDPHDVNGDWACEEVWSSGEDVFTVDTSDEEDMGWKHAQELFCEMIGEYLSSGGYASVLRAAKGVAAGFVDGELRIISLKE